MATSILTLALALGCACSGRNISTDEWEIRYFDVPLTTLAAIDGSVWVSGQCGGLFRWDGQRLREVDGPTAPRALKPGFAEISPCGDGTAWGRFSYGDDLYRYEGDRWAFHSAPRASFESLYCASSERAWAVHRAAIYAYNDGVWRPLFGLQTEDRKDLNSIWGPRCDPDRAWAVGGHYALRVTPAGLVRIAPLEENYLHGIGGRESMSCEVELVASGFAGGWRLDESRGSVWRPLMIGRVLLVEEGRIWHSKAGMLYESTPSGDHLHDILPPNMPVQKLARDREGRLWALGRETFSSSGEERNAMVNACDALYEMKKTGARSFVARRRYVE